MNEEEIKILLTRGLREVAPHMFSSVLKPASTVYDSRVGGESDRIRDLAEDLFGDLLLEDAATGVYFNGLQGDIEFSDPFKRVVVDIGKHLRGTKRFPDSSFSYSMERIGVQFLASRYTVYLVCVAICEVIGSDAAKLTRPVAESYTRQRIIRTDVSSKRGVFPIWKMTAATKFREQQLRSRIKRVNSEEEKVVATRALDNFLLEIFLCSALIHLGIRGKRNYLWSDDFPSEHQVQRLLAGTMIKSVLEHHRYNVWFASSTRELLYSLRESVRRRFQERMQRKEKINGAG